MTSRRFARIFASDRGGSIAIVFAMSLLALGLGVGIAMDFARAYSVQNALRSDLDAAVLGAASRLATPEAIQSAALAVFNENWRSKHQVSTVSLSVVKADDKTVTGTATATLPTSLRKLGGVDTMTVNAVSEVEVSNGNIELAMVLDTTLSMSGSKLNSLKSAAKSLVETAYENPDAEQHVKIGIVPFGQYVNVGLPNRNASWINVPADSSTPRESCGTTQDVTGTSNCRMETFNGMQDGQPYTYQSQVCDYTYGPPYNKCTNYTEVIAWYGCTGSRNNPLDTLDEQYSTKVPGVMNATCGAPITPLTNDHDLLDAQIDGLIAAGDTYIPAGVMWGWSILSKAEPFDQAVNYGEKVDGREVRKVMVLMTDGFNTLSPTYPEHWGNDTTRANELTTELCDNVKAKNIEIYTVAFEVADNAIKDILESCASSPGKFFDAEDSDQLTAAFRNIAKDFTPLRLAR